MKLMTHAPSQVPKTYSPREDLLNVISHAAGAVLSLAGTILLLFRAESLSGIISSLIYGFSLCVLFAGSALYHQAKDPAKRASLRLLDHSAIYFLIAGTYTPLMLRSGFTASEVVVLIVVWALAVTGVTLELLRIKPFKGFTILLYILMGWACMAVLPRMLENLPESGFSLLLAGGIAYTIGIPFYIMRQEFCHALWHFFVLGGAILQFCCIYLTVQ